MSAAPARPLYDALIVGAGPAGSVLARQLARGGCRVAVSERVLKTLSAHPAVLGRLVRYARPAMRGAALAAS